MTNPETLNILLLAHDVSDAAIAKRIEMLRIGGASVTVAGFRRSPSPITSLAGCPVIDLGRTRNGRFLQRIAMVVWVLLHLKRYKDIFARADVILARNLEMLAIAVAGTQSRTTPCSIVYEILDIHRMLLGSGLLHQGLRWLERSLLRHAQAMLTSSPAFITEYFNRINPTHLPIRLIENKPILPLPIHVPVRSTSQPWMIGWFGIIRCKKSLETLADIVRQNPGRVEVVIRGRPALDEIPNFHDVIAATPGLSFGGAYTSPDDLASLYNPIHFVWAIDMYEEGLNSSWLLPNRLYEGGAYGAVPFAIEGVEIANYLNNNAIGVVLPQPLKASLNTFLAELTPATYLQLAAAVQALPASHWICMESDCTKLIEFMRALKPEIHGASHV